MQLFNMRLFNMQLFKKVSLFTLLAVSLPSAFAQGADEHAALKQKLTDTLSLEISSIEPAPIAGLYQALTNRGMIYVSTDGSKLFHGNIYDIDNDMNNLTEAALAEPRLKMLKALEDQAIVYQAPNEKHVITVFTDITCGYCRKLHNEMQDYLDAGITIKYLAFPRQGLDSQNAKDLQAIWCSENPNAELDSAKAGKPVTAKATAMCKVDVAEHYQVGNLIGVNGTPALVLNDGTLIPGYQPAKQLAQALANR